jgi:hypothetical protein
LIARRLAALALGVGVGVAACFQEPAGTRHTPPPIQATAVITGVVTAPNGQPAVAQLVYMFSDFTATCSQTAPVVSLIRTNAAGTFRFERVVAPNEGVDLCVSVRVITEANSGYAESGRIDAYVDFRLFAPLDTASFDVVLTPR